MESNTIAPLAMPFPLALLLLLSVLLIIFGLPLWLAWKVYQRMSASDKPANWREEWGRIEGIHEYEETDTEYSPPVVTKHVRLLYSYDVAGRVQQDHQDFPQGREPVGLRVGQQVPVYVYGERSALARPTGRGMGSGMAVLAALFVWQLVSGLFWAGGLGLMMLFPPLMATLLEVVLYTAVKLSGGEASWPMVVKR